MTITHQLITEPAAGTTVSPVWAYTEDQDAQIEALREYAFSELLPESDAYRPWEKLWLERADTMPRYMRASKWKLEDAKKRIKGTLVWRRDFKPDLIPPEDIRVESETGKIILNGFDKDGRPIIWMAPAKENTPSSDRQLRHLVFVLERAKELQPSGQESIVILIDYRGTTLRTNPSISVARKVLTILQNHYVETLGRGLVVFLPTLLNFFYKGISPFLDPVTRDKIRFNPELTDLIPREQLWTSFGGDYPYEFEPKSYWDQLVANAGIAPDGTRVSMSSAINGDTSMNGVRKATNRADSSTPGNTATEALEEGLAADVDGAANELSTLAISDEVPALKTIVRDAANPDNDKSVHQDSVTPAPAAAVST